MSPTPWGGKARPRSRSPREPEPGVGFGDGVLYGVVILLVALIGLGLGLEHGGGTGALYVTTALIAGLLGFKLGTSLVPKLPPAPRVEDLISEFNIEALAMRFWELRTFGESLPPWEELSEDEREKKLDSAAAFIVKEFFKVKKPPVSITREEM